MKRILFTLLLITVVLAGTVAAVPVLPEEWYGAVFLNSNPAPAGTVIIAQVNGEARGQITTSESGIYGSQFGQNEPRLYSTSTEEEMNKGPVTVTFLVNGVQAFQAVTFEPGKLQKLDIYADSKAMPTSPPTVSPALSGGAGTGVAGSPSVIVPPTSAVYIPTTTISRAELYNQLENPEITTKPTTVVSTPVVTTSAPVTTQAPAGGAPLSTTTILIVVLVLAILVLAGVYMMKRGKGL
jgi:hypothetical protein